MKTFKRFNNLFGWLCFTAAFLIYMLTLQPAASFWDCGEFIASAYRLQVGHQPGAPLYMMTGKLFSLLASNPENIAFCLNAGSALVSAATIMFLFWTITAFAVKMYKTDKTGIPALDTVLIIGAGIVGAMAYAVSDSFWFSAVEAEVYSMSSLCTAVVFWAILKWEAEAEEPYSGRWLVFISYIAGLSIGIHLLSLLAIPAIVLLYYFRRNEEVTAKGILLSLLAGIAILAFVQYGVVQYIVLFAARFELFFVNTLGLGFGSGVLFFGGLLAGLIVYGIYWSHRKQRPGLNLALLCMSFIMLGYSSYAMIIIRANAGTSINVSNPDNVFRLLEYLGRTQYGDTPLLYGRYFDSQYTGSKETGRVYRKGKTKYEEAWMKTTEMYDRNTLFPRIYSSEKNDVQFYRGWLGLSENEHPSFADNIKFFFSYQAGFMYMRYFLWNFAGKQDDEQGTGDRLHGNWISGIGAADALRSGNLHQLSPVIRNNEGHNRFYCLPLVIGLIGFLYHYRKSRRDTSVIALLFFCTGIAIILYLNQDPLQVRERDYAYVGSFYAFAIWIGLGVLGLKDLLSRISAQEFSTGTAVLFCFAAAPLIMGYEGWDDHDRSRNYVAHDMAANYLRSCAPGAILFTNADNDTYPLWHAQEVEGIRPDVRIVNLQLMYDPSYVNALKRKLYQSNPLPLIMPEAKYTHGIRDVMPFVDYGITDSVELKDIFEVLISDNDSDKVSMQDGSRSNFLPTRLLKLKIDPKQLLSTGTIRPDELPFVSGEMKWNYNKNYVTRSDLALIDILSHNEWKRPVYFTVGLSPDSYFGLDNYLHLEGYTYRLLPFTYDKRDKNERTHNREMFSNVMKKYNLSSFSASPYLDPESRRVSRQTWDMMNSLAENLLREGEAGQAKLVMKKAMKDLPLRNYEIADTVFRYRTAMNLYQLNETAMADSIVKSSAGFLGSELVYYAALDAAGQQRSAGEIEFILNILEAFRREAEHNGRKEIVKLIRGMYGSVEGKLMVSES